ncbi:MAG: acyl-CoA mutase large subunit family protein [Ignavibacteria bacterium]|nr:acyl-CoA mutase large subunit family protein [Ignavibacteria bacterium]
MDKLSEKLNLKQCFPEVSYDEWKKVVEKDLKGQPFDKKLITKTYDGIDLKPIYNKEDIENIPFTDSKPGLPNYVRGTNSYGYLKDIWGIHQEIPFTVPEEFNEVLTEAIEKGQNCIVINPDRVTLLNLPVKEHYAHSDFGDGLSVISYRDFDKALKNIDLTKFPVFINAGFNNIPLLALFVAYLKKNKIDLKKISGGILADPYGCFVQYGNMPVSIEESFNHLAEATKWIEDNNVNLRTIGISALPYHNAGASVVQELAYAFSTAIDYINNLLDRGLNVNSVLSKIRFSFGIGSFYFMEISKLRAAKILWQKIAEQYGGNEKSQKIDILTVTSKYNQTARDPYVNMLRTTTEAFSAILGGADAIQTNPFDETFRLPDEFSMRIARNTQIILQEESHLHRLIDPAGGSYFIESLTSEIVVAVWKLFTEIQKNGGMLKALLKDIPQTETEKVHLQRIKDYAKRKSVIVGVNMYANLKETKTIEREQDFVNIYLKLFNEYKKERKNVDEVKLDKVFADKNIMDASEECAMAGGSREDISKNIFKTSEKRKIKPLKTVRSSEIFEILRDVTDDIKDKTGKTPSVFLAAMGPVKQHKARADFSRGFLEVAGLNVIYEKGYESAKEAVSDAVKSGAKAIAVCSTDETYPELVPQISAEVKKQSPGMLIILAGYPKEQIETFKSSGIEEFIYMGADVYDTLNRILKRLI